MALWGNRDSKTASGTIASIDADGNVVGSGTLFTTEAEIGNTIYTDGHQYVIVTIESDTECVVKPGIQGGEIEVGSSYSYTLSEKPAYVALSESGSSSGDSGDTTKVFGVDVLSNGENFDSAGRVIEVGVATGGSGYVEVPGVTFTGGGGSSAAATATISGGVVTSIAVTANGGSYENVPTVVVQVPVLTLLTAGVNTTTDVITYTAHGQVTTDALTYNNGGGTSITGLVSGTTYYVSKLTNDTFKLYDTAVNATAAGATGLMDLSGTGNDAQYFIIGDGVRATAVAALGGGTEGAESRSNIAHTGWVRRTVGTGGRAGRVHLETLVAMGSMTGDQADDRQFPDD